MLQTNSQSWKSFILCSHMNNHLYIYIIILKANIVIIKNKMKKENAGFLSGGFCRWGFRQQGFCSHWVLLCICVGLKLCKLIRSFSDFIILEKSLLVIHNLHIHIGQKNLCGQAKLWNVARILKGGATLWMMGVSKFLGACGIPRKF